MNHIELDADDLVGQVVSEDVAVVILAVPAPNELAVIGILLIAVIEPAAHVIGKGMGHPGHAVQGIVGVTGR